MTHITKAIATCFAVAVVSSLAVSTAFAEKRMSVPGQFIITFEPETSQHKRKATLKKHNAKIFDRIPELNAYSVEITSASESPSNQQTAATAKRLQLDPTIRLAEPNYIYEATQSASVSLFRPNDPLLSRQWAWDRIKAYSAWDTTQGSSSTKIAVIDTGVQRNHPDLNAKIINDNDPNAYNDLVDNDDAPDDGHGHGTHVAGTTAAETNNRTGGAGTSPRSMIMPVRVLNNQGSGSSTNVAKGILYAASHGAKVINLSLGSSYKSSYMERAVNTAWNRGVFLACAAGNSNTSTYHYPAAFSNCMAIASTDSNDKKSSFSNYGSWVRVAAPGRNILSTWKDSRYGSISGTSMASPHVAGAAALLSSQGHSNAQIRSRLCSTADRITGTGNYWTCGRLNLQRAVAR